MVVTTSDKTKAKAKDAISEMAKEWEKQGKVQHAIDGYERVIGMDMKSNEADRAREALLEIAKKFDKEGKKYSAYYIYQKMGYGKEGFSKRPA